MNDFQFGCKETCFIITNKSISLIQSSHHITEINDLEQVTINFA